MRGFLHKKTDVKFLFLIVWLIFALDKPYHIANVASFRMPVAVCEVGTFFA